MRRALLLCLLLPCCRAAAPSEEPSGKKAESRATAMPEHMRCKSASDCIPEPTCYWGTPACIAEASAPEPVKCGEDADPPRPEIGCACTSGQCTAIEK
jgi:hypothetical protein